MARTNFAVVAVALALVAATSVSASQPTVFSALAQWPAGTYASPAFAPDGKTLFVTHGAGTEWTLMISHYRGGAWSAPQAAPFSGRWRDIEPAMAPDGSYLLFVSNRPASGDGKPLDGFYNGAARPARGGNLWRVDRVRGGWSQPVRLPDTVNANASIYAPSLARNGDLVFMQPDPKTSRFRLYRARFVGGAYAAPEPLSFSDGVTADFDPVIAPDGSSIIFSSVRAPTPKGQSGVFVAVADGEGWRAPVALDPLVLGTETRLSPDRSTLFFSSDRPTPDYPAPPPGSTGQKIWSIPYSIGRPGAASGG